MTEADNLVPEHLRAIRGDIAGIKDEIRGLQAEQTASRHEMRAVTTRVKQVLEDNASVKVRLDRIENRLGLVDAVK